MTDQRPGGEPRVSFAVLALVVAGSAAVVLGLTALLVAVLDVPPAVRALVVLAGLVLAVAAMAVTSRRVTDRALGRADDGDPAAPAPEGR